MEQQKIIEDYGFAPSFSYYSSDEKTSIAVAKVIREEEEEKLRFHDSEDVEFDDFEFSFVLSNEKISIKEIDSVFTVSDRDLLVTDEVDREIKRSDASTAITRSLRKLFIGEREESSSYSSSEADELEDSRSGTYCLWRPKADDDSSKFTSKSKKSCSAARSGSKRWILRYLLRRTSNSEAKQSTVLLTPKKVDSPNHKLNSGSRRKPQTPVHEQFYVQRRAENEFGKRKTYLPYKKDIVGLFVNVNDMGKILPF